MAKMFASVFLLLSFQCNLKFRRVANDPKKKINSLICTNLIFLLVVLCQVVLLYLLPQSLVNKKKKDNVFLIKGDPAFHYFCNQIIEMEMANGLSL